MAESTNDNKPKEAEAIHPTESTNIDASGLSAQSADSQPSPPESRKDKILLAIVVAVLSFVGAAGGSLIAASLDTFKWQREINYTVRRERFRKRIELLERAVKVVNQSNSARALNVEVQAFAELTKLGAYRNNDDAIERIRPVALRREELGVEYATTMSLVGLYFGPKTKEALRKLTTSNRPWWEREHSEYEQLFTAMEEELQNEQ